jgi:hypothetical protein
MRPFRARPIRPGVLKAVKMATIWVHFSSNLTDDRGAADGLVLVILSDCAGKKALPVRGGIR